MRLLIKRTHTISGYTYGCLFVDGEFDCFTAERHPMTCTNKLHRPYSVSMERGVVYTHSGVAMGERPCFLFLSRISRDGFADSDVLENHLNFVVDAALLMGENVTLEIHE